MNIRHGDSSRGQSPHPATSKVMGTRQWPPCSCLTVSGQEPVGSHHSTASTPPCGLSQGPTVALHYLSNPLTSLSSKSWLLMPGCPFWSYWSRAVVPALQESLDLRATVLGPQAPNLGWPLPAMSYGSSSSAHRGLPWLLGAHVKTPTFPARLQGADPHSVSVFLPYFAPLSPFYQNVSCVRAKSFWFCSRLYT